MLNNHRSGLERNQGAGLNLCQPVKQLAALLTNVQWFVICAAIQFSPSPSAVLTSAYLYLTFAAARHPFPSPNLCSFLPPPPFMSPFLPHPRPPYSLLSPPAPSCSKAPSPSFPACAHLQSCCRRCLLLGSPIATRGYSAAARMYLSKHTSPRLSWADEARDMA